MPRQESQRGGIRDTAEKDRGANEISQNKIPLLGKGSASSRTKPEGRMGNARRSPIGAVDQTRAELGERSGRVSTP